ncbi:MAG: hypothetical protein ACRERD_19155 [Candidatus Binatia bacterium]
MSDTKQHTSSTVEAADPAETIFQHLLRKPSDLVDSRRLIRRFRASADDFQRALKQFEERTVHEQSPSLTVEAADPAERIFQHLLRKPSDLVDSRQMIRRFRASAEDVQRALKQFEEHTFLEGEKAPG